MGTAVEDVSRQLREANLTLRDVAALAGQSEGYVSRQLHGSRQMTLPVVQALRKLLRPRDNLLARLAIEAEDRLTEAGAGAERG